MVVPTILIPGIKGTTLVNTNTLDFDTIWSGIQSKFESIYGLELKKDVRFEVEPRAIIERSDVEDLAYREAVIIINRKTESPIYIFGYDWRKSCADNGRRLRDYVNYLREKIETDKFNFLTHSMGGMVFSCYLKELAGNYDIIDHAILTACPFEGSINALISLIVGEGGFKFPLFNSNDEFRKIARTFPSVYELLPVYHGAITFSSGEQFDLYNPNHWQSNISSNPIFLDRLSQLKNFRQTNPAMVKLNQLPAEAKGKFLVIIGDGEGTKNKIIIQPQDPRDRVKNLFDFDQPETPNGDGTVPFESSTIYKDDILTIAIKSKWYDKATHGFFLNDGRVQTIINRFLKDDTGYREWWSDIGDSVRKV